MILEFSHALFSEERGLSLPVQVHVYLGIPALLGEQLSSPTPLVTRLSRSAARAPGVNSVPAIKEKKTNACSVEPCILMTQKAIFFALAVRLPFLFAQEKAQFLFPLHRFTSLC